MSGDLSPSPIPDRDTLPFWDACRRHELRAQRCTACGRFRWPPRCFCPACWSLDVEWALLPGRGTVQSFSVVHHRLEVPNVVAQIALDGTDGHVQLLSNIVGCSWEEVQVGLSVNVVFDDVSPDVTLPKFRPVS